MVDNRRPYSEMQHNNHNATTNIDKLRLLIWKNMLIQYRHPIRTLIEIILFGLNWLLIYYLILLHDKSYGNNQIDSYREILAIGIGILMCNCLAFPVANSVRYMTSEKEKQLKEAMIIMGLPCWLHWIGWFIRTMIFMIVAISICVLVLKAIPSTNGIILWMFLFVYSISMTTYCFMLSSFFSKVSMSSIVALIGWFALLVPYFLTEKSTSIVQFVSCISLNTALMRGLQIIFKPSTEYSSLGIVMIFLLGSSLLHLLIALYVEKIFPGNYGVPEKWYFPITKEFWFGMKSDDTTEDESISSNANFESDPQNCPIGIKVKNLRKMYANKKVAVNRLTLNVFDDQITVLLGHNGAGKTTVMSMLTGMIPPTSGTAVLNGYDIRKNLQKARSSIGYCPQHNILFDELTVREHIEFYGQLKGLKKIDVKNEVNKYIQKLELSSTIDKSAQSLSGGMKRKLSVVIALCGGSNVVFLDEPSSGLDPTARRSLWNLLQEEKKGRTILLTTHFMDEADALGDRIAIMATGELKCYGTSFYLKQLFGSGYYLVCAKNNECNVNAVTATLREFIPDVKVYEDIANELTYVLPVEHVDKFKNLFEVLEQNQHDLGISSFGVSLTPLEEIFLKFASDTGITDNNLHQQNDLITSDVELASTPLLRGFSFHLNQWHAMLKKHFICLKRRWIMLMIQNLIPLMTAISFIMHQDYMCIYAMTLTFSSKFYIMFYIRERAANAKLLQFVSGLNVFTYWMSSFLFDYIMFLLMAFISIIPFLAHQNEIWADISALYVTIMTFGFAILPVIYVFSFLFKSPSAGFNVMSMIPIALVFIFFIAKINRETEPQRARQLEWYFQLLPSYSFFRSCDKLRFIIGQTKSNVYSWDEECIGQNLTCMAVVGVVFFVILALIESRSFGKIFGKSKSKKESLPNGTIDNDVLKEKQNVDAMTDNELQASNLVLKKLTKFYGNFLAVNEISIAVKGSECFGLLGVNGAGKTSTFKMLTGDISISSGAAYVQGINLKSDMLKVNKIIGYCPQFDALLDDLTGIETLEIFALLRGVHRKDVRAVIENLAHKLNFTQHLDKKIAKFSGGNKRKLSTAIALIGNPVVIYLDEPSSGMDIGAKRNLWKVLSKVRSFGKSIVLTSHSMEECEALCTRLAIMVNGEFKCLGSTQHLKNKFSKGFWLTIKISESIINDLQSSGNALPKIKDFINQNFSGADLKEEYNELVKYYIPPSDLKWSNMFGIMEVAKQELPIEDYSISQTSLEQVFLSLTKFQQN